MVVTWSRSWETLVARGIVAILFGVIALLFPRLTLGILIFLFAAWVLADGITALIAGLRVTGDGGRSWTLILAGALGILIGIIALVFPAATAIVLLFLIAAWAIVRGIIEIGVAITSPSEVRNRWLLALSGIVSVLFGIAIAVVPGASLLAFIWLIALFAIIYGALQIVLGLRMRQAVA